MQDVQTHPDLQVRAGGQQRPAPLPSPTPPARPDWPAVRLGGLDLLAATEQQVVQHVLDAADAGQGGWIVTANLDIARQASNDGSLRSLFGQADLVVADGMPLVWASYLAGRPLPERVAGSSMVSTLAGAAAKAGRSIFLLGGNPGAAEGAAEALQRQFPRLQIAGTLCPPYGFENDEDQMRAIEKTLREAAPDIVYVALGCPKQERLIARLRPALPDAWWIGVGISFSFLSGEVHRAPRWAQRAGLEWCHRLAQEPRRLARRYLVQGVPFALTLLWSALVGRSIGQAHTAG